MNATPENIANEKTSLLDMLLVLARHKKMIVGLTVAVTLIAGVIVWRMPDIYTGTVKIMPPQGQSPANMMLNQLGGTGSIAGGALGIKSPGALYVAMLQSRTVTSRVAGRFNLKEIYALEKSSAAVATLAANTSAALSKEGIISLTVNARDPKLAADLANAFIEELNKLMLEFALSDASRKRLFFEQQMKQAKDKLTDAELVLDRTPNTSLHYLGAVRNLKSQEAVYEIMAKQFEMAKLEEAKDFPLIQVLDAAIPPEKKSKPKRKLIVIAAALVAFCFAIVLAFLLEALTSAKQRPEQAVRLNRLRAALWR